MRLEVTRREDVTKKGCLALFLSQARFPVYPKTTYVATSISLLRQKGHVAAWRPPFSREERGVGDLDEQSARDFATGLVLDDVFQFRHGLLCFTIRGRFCWSLSYLVIVIVCCKNKKWPCVAGRRRLDIVNWFRSDYCFS